LEGSVARLGVLGAHVLLCISFLVRSKDGRRTGQISTGVCDNCAADQ
jgi:hypothetical protein